MPTIKKFAVSRDLPRSTVTEQIAFDQRDLHSTPVFERAMYRHCLALVSKLETLDPSLLPYPFLLQTPTNDRYANIHNGPKQENFSHSESKPKMGKNFIFLP